jgi:hypothetical protein
MRINGPSKTQQTLFILKFQSFSTEIESKSPNTKHRTPGHTNKQRPTLYLHRRTASSPVTGKHVQTCTLTTRMRITAVCMRLGTRFTRKLAFLVTSETVASPQQALSAYSYPLTQFLSNEKLQQVMAQIETTLRFWVPRPEERGRPPEAWRNFAARMATFALKWTSKSQADTILYYITQHNTTQFYRNLTVTVLIKDPCFWSSSSVRRAMTFFKTPEHEKCKRNILNALMSTGGWLYGGYVRVWRESWMDRYEPVVGWEVHSCLSRQLHTGTCVSTDIAEWAHMNRLLGG